MSDKEKTLAKSAYCHLLTGPVPKTERDYRRAIVLACLIGRQIEHDFQQQQPQPKAAADTKPT